ncbi:MAG: T9SS type A sorting domain-containing protein, partial [Fibrobacterota bacterium]
GMIAAPNPFSPLLKLSFRGKTDVKSIRVSIYDMQGRQRYSRVLNSPAVSHTVNTSLWSSGTYIVEAAIGSEVLRSRVTLIK